MSLKSIYCGSTIFWKKTNKIKYKTKEESAEFGNLDCYDYFKNNFKESQSFNNLDDESNFNSVKYKDYMMRRSCSKKSNDFVSAQEIHDTLYNMYNGPAASMLQFDSIKNNNNNMFSNNIDENTASKTAFDYNKELGKKMISISENDTNEEHAGNSVQYSSISLGKFEEYINISFQGSSFYSNIEETSSAEEIIQKYIDQHQNDYINENIPSNFNESVNTSLKKNDGNDKKQSFAHRFIKKSAIAIRRLGFSPFNDISLENELSLLLQYSSCASSYSKLSGQCLFVSFNPRVNVRLITPAGKRLPCSLRKGSRNCTPIISRSNNDSSIWSKKTKKASTSSSKDNLFGKYNYLKNLNDKQMCTDINQSSSIRSFEQPKITKRKYSQVGPGGSKTLNKIETHKKLSLQENKSGNETGNTLEYCIENYTDNYVENYFDHFIKNETKPGEKIQCKTDMISPNSIYSKQFELPVLDSRCSSVSSRSNSSRSSRLARVYRERQSKFSPAVVRNTELNRHYYVSKEYPVVPDLLLIPPLLSKSD